MFTTGGLHMPIKFDIKLTSEDMYRFNMYHAYTSMQGILSLILGIFVIAVIAFSGDFHDFVSAAPYLLIAVIFFLYIPITLRLRSKRQIRMSPVLKDTLHFEMNDEGITVRSVGEEEAATLPWEYIYKAVTTKHNLLIYSNRVNAYVIPKGQVSQQLPQIYEALKAHCESFRLHLK